MRRPQSAGTIQAGFDVFIASLLLLFRSVIVGNNLSCSHYVLDVVLACLKNKVIALAHFAENGKSASRKAGRPSGNAPQQSE